MVKSKTKMYWGHKASVIGLPKQGIAIDAVAIMDAASHDGQTFLPHAKHVFARYPELTASIERVLYDSACDDAELKAQFEEDLGVELKASFNPRRTKPVTQDLPRGIAKITPYGVPICLAGHELDYKGIRYDSEKFIYEAPRQDDGISVYADGFIGLGNLDVEIAEYLLDPLRGDAVLGHRLHRPRREDLEPGGGLALVRVGRQANWPEEPLCRSGRRSGPEACWPPAPGAFRPNPAPRARRRV